MKARITRPTLAELWRVLLTILEDLGAENAPDVARSLATAGLTGRPAESSGVLVVRRGEEVVIIAPDPSRSPGVLPAAWHDAAVRSQAPRRRRVLALR